MSLTHPHHFPSFFRRIFGGFAACSIAAIMLVGCSSTDGLIDNVIGTKNKDTILPGKREAVLSNNVNDAANSSIANAPVFIPAAKTNSNWSQPGGNASNVMQSLALGRSLKRVFAVEGGAGSDEHGRMVASPIVVGGKVCVLDSRAKLRCFNANNGGMIWKTNLVPTGKNGKGAYGGGIASDGGRIYATTAFGEVLALDSGSGAIIWRQSVGSSIRSAPTISNGRIYFVTSSNEGVALSAANGGPVWRTQGSNSQAGVISSPSPAISGSLVVMPSSSGDLAAYGTGDGSYRWTQSMQQTGVTTSRIILNDIAGRPVISGNHVIAVASAGRIASFSTSGGEQWSRDLPGTQTPWVSGDYVFAVVDRSNLVAISLASGGVKWLKELPGGGTWAGPVMGGGRLLVVSASGKAVSISPQTGQVMNTLSIGESFYIPPVIANGTLYLLANNGTLMAYR